MKITKVYFFIFACISLFSCGESKKPILDINFAKAIRASCPDCIDAKNRLMPAAAKLKKLDVSGKNIASFEGFDFPELEFFICQGNGANTLPTLPATLEHLSCQGNQLTSLPNLPSNLTYLNCANNQFTSLPNMDLPKLVVFNCASNKIASLPNLNLPNLESLDVEKNMLTTLPNLNLPKLTNLVCSDNQIASIPNLNLPLLETFWCRNNPLQNLPALPSSLKKLYIEGSNIKCVPVGTTADIDLGVVYPFCPEN